MTDRDREIFVQLFTREQDRRFRLTASRQGVFDTKLGLVVERNQYPIDAEYICRRLNAGLGYTPGGHTGPEKVWDFEKGGFVS